MSKLLCWWTGHKPALYGEECARCGNAFTYEEWCKWTPRQRLESFCRRRFRWFLRCDDCGKRFGRHDDTIQHIPF